MLLGIILHCSNVGFISLSRKCLLAVSRTNLVSRSRSTDVFYLIFSLWYFLFSVPKYSITGITGRNGPDWTGEIKVTILVKTVPLGILYYSTESLISRSSLSQNRVKHQNRKKKVKQLVIRTNCEFSKFKNFKNI
jgi:hypothetical protein